MPDKICSLRILWIIEHNAHGLFGKYNGRPLGTFGCMATLSFHETKNLICGEGGALIINDPKYAERADFIRHKGTNRTHFLTGQVDKYTWVDVGSSYVLSEILAAYLYAQLEERHNIFQKRCSIWERYFENLRHLLPLEGRLPFIPSHCEQAYHMFFIRCQSLKGKRNIRSFSLPSAPSFSHGKTARGKTPRLSRYRKS